jgi:hypothetical protein
MEHFGGLDVSVKETSICIVDDTGRIVKEVKVASEPEALLKVLGKPAYRFKRIGLEAGPLSQWRSDRSAALQRNDAMAMTGLMHRNKQRPIRPPRRRVVRTTREARGRGPWPS